MREPIEVELLGGQIAHTPLPRMRKLFHPETFLGHADIAIKYLASQWDDHFAIAFSDAAQFREGLVWHLALLSFLDDESESYPLYPTYRLVDDARRALRRLAGRVKAIDTFADGVASIFDEDAQLFRARWRERAELANEAQLGGGYWHNEVRVPELPSPEAPD